MGDRGQPGGRSDRDERAVRASDAERERTVELLRAHAGAGRLSVEELSARVERALTARTRRELRTLTADLPRLRSRRGARRCLRAHALAYVGVGAAAVGSWAVGGADDPERLSWLLWWGAGLTWHWNAVRGRLGRGQRRRLLSS